MTKFLIYNRMGRKIPKEVLVTLIKKNFYKFLKKVKKYLIINIKCYIVYQFLINIGVVVYNLQPQH